MANHNLKALAGVSALALTLTACGGGGGVGSMPTPDPAPTPSPTPTPTPTPTPAPTPTPTPTSSANPLSAAPTGVTATTNFTSIGVLEDVRWDTDLKAYEVTFDGAGARLHANYADPSQEHAELVAPDGTVLPDTIVANAGYSYTRFGTVYGPNSVLLGNFAFGVATPAGSVPTTGTATYDAEIRAHGGPNWDIRGPAQFSFDFGKGTLSGHMDPSTSGPYWEPTFPRYTFTQTVFSPGSTTFSGSFDIDGPTPSSFQGQFTGPHAEELMASFTAPFLDLDWDTGNQTVWRVMEGVMVGKRH